MTLRAVISGTGAYLPEHILTNHDLEQMMDTSDAWIRERTGITQRHIAADGELTSDLAAKAARIAMENAGVDPSGIDLVLVATSTPDLTMPSTATIVQHKLGITQGFAFDLAAACSGFVYGLTVAHSLILAGQAKRALVIGAETMSRIVDWEDRSTCILFGDGAGAVLLEAEEGTDRGIITSRLYSDGAHGPILCTDGGTSYNKQAGHLTMAGQEVFRHGVEKMATAASDLLASCKLTVSNIDWVVPHQANIRIIQSIARKLRVAPEKFMITLDKHANTSAASIPLALHQAHVDKKLKSGQIVAMPALGAGLTWGCCIIKW